MVLLLDADALIKLHLAGILEDVAGTFDCIIPEGIIHEVVTRGKQFHHPDAESIGKIIEAGIAVHSSSEITYHTLDVPGVDAGEKDLLALFYTLPTSAEAIIISDDRRFLTVIQHEEIPALTPPDLVISISRQGFLPRQQARTVLSRMRPYIRDAAYRQALSDIESEKRANYGN